MLNEKFGKLFVLEKTNKKYKDGQIIYKCQCDCGNICYSYSSVLKNGNKKSCGCLKKENNKDGVFNKKYTLNQDFFESIDSEEKAYWLGFIAADGCVQKNKLILELKIKDQEHLNKFKISLKSNSPIKNYRINSATLQINSKRLCSDLLKYGITPKKSLTLDINLELIPQELHRHFWRGMIDGDGWVSKTEKSCSIGLCGTYNICKEFKTFVLENNIKTISSVRKNKNIYSIHFGGINLFNKIFNLLYKNSIIYLSRKFISSLDRI